MALEYSTVRVNITTIAADGIDFDDIPDDTPLTGTLELAPMIAAGSAIQYDDSGTLKLKTVSPVTVDIGITGDIAHQGRDYVKVLAPTASTTNLAQLQWRASFKNLRFGSQVIAMQPIYFYATPGADINLADHVNVAPSSLAVQLSRGPRGFGIGQIATDSATDELVFKLDDNSGTEVGRIVLPEAEVSDTAVADLVAADTATKAALDVTYVASDTPSNRTQFSSKLSLATAGASPSSRYQLFSGQEPSVVRWGGKYRMYYGLPGQGVQYRECAETDDPRVTANWSAPTAVLSGGSHHSLFVEGDNLYLYYVDVTNENFCVATGSTSDWKLLTKQTEPVSPPIGNLASKTSGNTYVVKNGSSYVMFAEARWIGTLGGVTGMTWQTYVMTAPSPVGPFAGPVLLTSLRPRGVGQVSGMSVYREEDRWVTVFHGAASPLVSLPNDIYRAVNKGSITADTWEIVDNGRPFIRRAHECEVDQAVDPVVCDGPGGELYEFHSGNQNRNTATTGTFWVMASRLYPGLTQKLSGTWRRAVAPTDGQQPASAVPAMVYQDTAFLSPTGTACKGQWGVLPDSAALGGGVRQNVLGKMDDWIGFQRRVSGGSYSLRILAETGPDMGQMTVDIIPGVVNDSAIKSVMFDLYSTTRQLNNSLSVSFTLGPEFDGPLWIRFKSTGKNASSSGYRIADQGWQLLRTDLVDPGYVPKVTAGAIIKINDDFARADAVTNVGPLWVPSAAFQVVGGKLSRNASATDQAVLRLSRPLTPNIRVSAEITRGTSTAVGLVVRRIDDSNLIGCRVNNLGHILIYKIVAGTTSSIIGVDGKWTDGATLMVEAIDDTFTVYVDGVVVITPTVHVESALAAATGAGVRVVSNGASLPTLDNFTALSW
jgi:hypothetical protein